jgi:hypothetical protein
MSASNRGQKRKHLPPAPEQLRNRWQPPGIRKNQPSSSVPTQIRRDKRQLSLTDCAASPSTSEAPRAL